MRVGYGISGTNTLSVGLGTVSVGGGGGGQPVPCEPVDQIGGNLASPSTFAHPADGVVAVTIAALQSDGVMDIRVRAVDGSNFWLVRISASGALQLFEVPEFTTRGSAGGVSSGSRVAVVLHGTTIQIYVDQVLRIDYDNATVHQTATGGRVNWSGTGGQVADLKTWTLACRAMEGV